MSCRYDEEDDRMKAIAAGDDPGNLGIKDTSSLMSSLSSVGGSLNIKELCNPRSSPKMQQPNLSKMVSPEVITQPPPNIVSHIDTLHKFVMVRREYGL